MNRIFGAVGTMLSLVALYLVLVNAAGATKIFNALSGGSVKVFRTLQGR